jgi:HEAT repeat protein/beta-lactamase regulating signal transducer with metallopeptidase domain
MRLLDAVGWGLVHFVWQGALVAGVTAIALEATRRSAASVRYAIGIAALATMAALPIVTTWRAVTVPGVGTGVVPGVTPVPAEASELRGAGTDLRAAAEPRPASDEALVYEGRTTPADGWRQMATRVRQRSAPLLAAALPWLVALWALGVLLLSARLVGGWLRARRFRIQGVTPAPDWCSAAVTRLAARLDLRRRVRVLESKLVEVPLVMGALRPMILLPASALSGLSVDQLEAILAHELAHVRRHDYLVNLVQSVVETLLFYHPAVWWVSRQVRLEREHCCDDLAVAVCGNREGFARALVGMERLRFTPPAAAVRANGGSLVMRVRRLLTPELSHVDAASRSAAAVIAMATALTIGVAASVPAMVSPASPRLIANPPAALSHAQAAPAAQPPTIVKAADLAAPLGERWAWAERESRTRNWSRYWVGYAIQPPAGMQRMFYSDRGTRVVGDGVSFSGTFSGDFTTLRFPGVAIGALVGGGDSRRVKALFSFTRDGGGSPSLARTHASSFELPVELSGAPLVWLGDADAAASLPLVERLYARTSAVKMQSDLVNILGLHDDSTRVVPMLVKILNGDAASEVRGEAAERLAWHPVATSLSALDRAARSDRVGQVRREAAETMGELAMPEAFDALVALIKSVDDEEVRREAVESLGERTEPAVRDTLVGIARTDRSREVQREAVETLGEVKDPGVVAALIDLARTHPDSEIRREAIETIGEAAPSKEAVEFLAQAARQDPRVDVQQEAIETLAEIDADAGRATLVEFATSHPSPEGRKRAVEALAQMSQPAEAVALLKKVAREDSQVEVQRDATERLGEIDAPAAAEALFDLARTHPALEVRREAVETLGEAPPSKAIVDTLARIATDDRSPDVQREAVETLGEVGDGLGLPEVARLATAHPSIDIRREAIETLAEHAPPATALEVLKRIIDSDPSEDARREAIESLTELHDGAGIPALIDVARSHPNREVRAEALKRLVEIDDPRVRAVFERALAKP